MSRTQRKFSTLGAFPYALFLAMALIPHFAVAQEKEEPILFPFDVAQEEINPTFIEGNISVSFVNNPQFDRQGVVRLVQGSKATPFSGEGHLVLGSLLVQAPTPPTPNKLPLPFLPTSQVSMIMNFSSPLERAEMRALQLESGTGPLVFEAFSELDGQGEMVATAQTQFFASPPIGPQNYETIAVAAAPETAIRSVVITGSAKYSIFDELVAYPYDFCILPDLIASQIEVTQAIQDLNNSVRLVEGKRTFVRFHVRSATFLGGTTYASLTLRQGGSTRIVYPINDGTGEIYVGLFPDRNDIDDAFLFEVPDGFNEGTLEIEANLNFEERWRPRSPSECTYDNNVITETVSFENVPTLNLVMYRVGYRDGSSTIYPDTFHRDELKSWIERAYPTDKVCVWNRSYYFGNSAPTDCGDVNFDLLWKKIWDVVFTTSIPLDARYYGIVDDNGGSNFMRGCATAIPSYVASGPTGTSSWGWDYDGTYGDWYGGHEIGHTFGRYHAEFCGAGGGTSYPYPDGDISPTHSGHSAIYGFDIETLDIYAPDWKDFMTYCSNQWIGDYNYEGLMDYFQGELSSSGGASGIAGANNEPRMIVLGQIDPETQEVKLSPSYAIPVLPGFFPSEQGLYQLVLRDVQGQELYRHSFQPGEVEEGQSPNEDDEEHHRHVHYLQIAEHLPLIPEATILDVEGPQGLLHSVRSGPAFPEVTVTAPKSGTQIHGDGVLVSWMASDKDGDELSFTVQYSGDGGESWETVVANVSGDSVHIDRVNLTASNNGRFRVWATDGLHAASAESQQGFTVVNVPPSLELREPKNRTIASQQTLRLEASGYDIDVGTLHGAMLSWSSNIDGLLGSGEGLSVSDLSPGQHTITARADDGAGGLETRELEITVVETPLELAPAETSLEAVPSRIVLNPSEGVHSAKIQLRSKSGSNAVSFLSDTQTSWLVMNRSYGPLPGAVVVEADNTTSLTPGVHEATIVVSSPELPGKTTVVTIELHVPEEIKEDTFRRGDPNADGSADLSDALDILYCLFLGQRCTQCPDAEDFDDDGSVTLTDAISILKWRFLGQGGPAAPGADVCGVDPTEDTLEKCERSGCE